VRPFPADQIDQALALPLLELAVVRVLELAPAIKLPLPMIVTL
jgi:hypothetical protein